MTYYILSALKSIIAPSDILTKLPTAINNTTDNGFAFSMHLPSQSPAMPAAAISPNIIRTDPKICRNDFISLPSIPCKLSCHIFLKHQQTPDNQFL